MVKTNRYVVGRFLLYQAIIVALGFGGYFSGDAGVAAVLVSIAIFATLLNLLLLADDYE